MMEKDSVMELMTLLQTHNSKDDVRQRSNGTYVMASLSVTSVSFLACKGKNYSKENF